jgi:MYXO-CTERM domain-containing protein
MRAAPWIWTSLLALTLLPSKADASRVVFVNTEPVTITAGMANDPTTDTVNVNGFTTTEFDGWVGATDEQKAMLLALMKDTSVAFDIIYTLERPDAGPYDMVVLGSADDHMSSFGGTCSTQVGLSDCGDANGAALAFAYWGCLDMADQQDPERVAFHTLGGLGYGWGLENIAGNGQVMSSWTNTALRFGDACANLANGPSGCMHADCSIDQQNSTADLLANLGARVDDGPPTIVVIEPQPGADVTAPFDVVVDVQDAFGGLSAQIEIVGSGSPAVTDDSFPYRWDALGLPAGPVTLRVTAFDADGGEASVDIPVCVGGGCPDTGDGDGDGDAGETSGDGDAGETAGDGTAGASPGDPKKGCSVDSRGGTLVGLMLLGLLGLIRRRR